MRWMLLLSGLLFAQPAHAENCQASWSLPQTSAPGTLLCRQAYVAYHDDQAKIPRWISYALTPDNLMGCTPRINSFRADPDLPQGRRAELNDYARTGYDIGHMASSADMTRNEQVQRESFYLSNMAPQLPENNRGEWAQLESGLRGWVWQNQKAIVIHVGPIYSASSKTIGPNRVTVPEAFYKVAVDMQSNHATAWIMSQKTPGKNDLSSFIVTVRQLEEQTGIVFPNIVNKNTLGIPMLGNAQLLRDARTQRCGR